MPYKDPDKAREYRKKYYKLYYRKNKEKLNAASKKWRVDNVCRVKGYWVKNLNKLKEYWQKYYLTNAKSLRLKKKKYALENVERIKERSQRYLSQNPWANAYKGALGRCVNPRNNVYGRYGGRGIRFSLSMRDFEHLWFRDNADMMDRPSIDRVDPDGHYELSNCRFIELSENISRARKKGI